MIERLYSSYSSDKNCLLKIIGGFAVAAYLFNGEISERETKIVNNIYICRADDMSELEIVILKYSKIEDKPISWYEKGLEIIEELSKKHEEYSKRLEKTKEHLLSAYKAIKGENENSD